MTNTHLHTIRHNLGSDLRAVTAEHWLAAGNDEPHATKAPACIGLAPVRPGARVLHVDGDVDAALMLATLLMPEIHLTHVYTLSAALRAVAAEHYDMVVLDPDLPDGDGMALAAALHHGASATPLLLYAAQHTPWRDQADAFLLKPWTAPRELWNTVSRLVGLGDPVAVAL